MQPLGFGDKNGYTDHAFLYDFCCCAEQWSEFCVGIMICIGALITVAVLKGTKLLSAYAFFAYTGGRAGAAPFVWF